MNMYSKNSVIKNLREERNKLKDRLEAVREFVLSRRDEIENDMENFGMLRPVLSYFLEESEG